MTELHHERAYFERGFIAAYAWAATKLPSVQISDAVIDHAWDHRDEGMSGDDILPILTQRPPEQAGAVPAGLVETRREGCIGIMDAKRATYFLERFKREEKWLGPHEQWALDYTIAVLAAPTPPDAGPGEIPAGMVEALVEPWKDHHGPLPDFDSPVACVFDAGVQYAVELLAKELGVTDWTPCDGTEEYDGDLGGTLMNVVREAMPLDQHGERMWPSEFCAALTPKAPPQTPPDAGPGEIPAGMVVYGPDQEKIWLALEQAAIELGGAGAHLISSRQSNLWLDIAIRAYANLADTIRN